MDTYEPQTIGVGLMVAISLLGAYFLILRIRSYHAEVRDPDLCYVTNSQMEKLRCEFLRVMAEATHDLRSLRSEIRDDTRSLQRQHAKSLLDLRELAGKNAQDISALIAQTQVANQRINELSVRTDKLTLKLQER